MSDALPDDAWVQSFQATSPKPLFDTLKRRLQASTTHVSALSELFKQRAAIETQYAESLAKLAKTAEGGGLNGKSGVEWEKSGGEAKLWDIVVTDLVEVSLGVEMREPVPEGLRLMGRRRLPIRTFPKC
jgi:hypothetical protein